MSLHFTALAFFEKFTARQYLRIKDHLPNACDIYRADKTTLLHSGWTEDLANDFVIWRRDNPTEKFAEILKTKNISAVCLDDADYPPLLRELSDPPVTLFYRGQLKSDERTVAVVGTRKMSPYAKQITWQITEPLARQGITIVSGLALGVDREAHEATLAGSGRTIAILGGSVEKNCIYPSSHNNLAEKIIASGGLVMSEYPPGFSPTLYSFPMRNRIVAGLSHGILVIEAPEKSGSLITARAALDSNREVFCIPHPLNHKNGLGGNLLIQNCGALLTINHEDILKALHWENKTPAETKPDFSSLDPREQKIMSVIKDNPKHIEEIIKTTRLPSREIAEALSMLELQGMVKNLGNMTYGRIV